MIPVEAPLLDAAASPTAPDERVAARTPTQLALARLRHDRGAIVAAVVIASMVLLALCAPLIARWAGHPVNEQYRDTGLTEFGLPVGPRAEFWLGTDQLGRDLLVRLAYGARVSIVVGAVSTLAAVGVGAVIGLAAGFLGGWVDRVLSWLIDTTLSLPFLLFAISLVALVGPGLGVTIVVIILFSWCPIARVVRGQVLFLREREFVEAARSLGASRLRIMAVDVLPNLVVPLVVYGTLLVPQAIVFEATLSFLGLGVAATDGHVGIDAGRGGAALSGGVVDGRRPGVCRPRPDARPQRARRLAARRLRRPADRATCQGVVVIVRFLLYRIASGALTLFVISLVMFILFYVAPNDPARTIAGPQATSDVVEQIQRRLGLDQPLPERFGQFLGDLLHGDLGYSYYNQRPVLDTILDRLPVTASVAIGAAVLWTITGIPIGVASARRPG